MEWLLYVAAGLLLAFILACLYAIGRWMQLISETLLFLLKRHQEPDPDEVGVDKPDHH